MTHPLTDEELKKLFWDYAVDTGIGYDWTSDGMRAAADWQLEQVIEWLKDYTKSVEFRYHPQYVTTRLKKEMRPQKSNC